MNLNPRKARLFYCKMKSRHEKTRSVLLVGHASQLIAELLERRPDKLVLLPEVGSEESIGVADGSEGGLEGILESLGGTGRVGVDVRDTSELEKTLDSGGSNETGTTGSRDQLEIRVRKW